MIFVTICVASYLCGLVILLVNFVQMSNYQQSTSLCHAYVAQEHFQLAYLPVFTFDFLKHPALVFC